MEYKNMVFILGKHRRAYVCILYSVIPSYSLHGHVIALGYVPNSFAFLRIIYGNAGAVGAL